MLDKTSDQQELPWVDFEPKNASFPSDHLSIKRLRTVFPDSFDKPDSIVNGYTACDFFYPAETEKPAHLMRLTDLLCDERTIAGGAFRSARYGVDLEGEEKENVAESRTRLEAGYQFFKLADSPETARLLIQQVEEEGKREAARLVAQASRAP